MKPEEKIYHAYFESKMPELYFNQIKEATKLSDSSLTNSLKKLVENNILGVNKTRSNTFYKIKDTKIVALYFSQIAITKFKCLNIGVRIPLQNFLKKISDDIFTVILFGSASIKEETENSDIDILLVSDSKIRYDSIKKEVDAVSNYPLNIFACTIKQFKENKDHMIVQARETGFPIKGEQNYYGVILDES